MKLGLISKVVGLGLLISAIGAVIKTDSANACWLCKRRDDVIDSVKDPVNSFKAEFKICNKHGSAIHYNMNERNQTIQPGYCTSWTTDGKGAIVFHNGRRNIRYLLGDGTYNFQIEPIRAGNQMVNVIKLYKE